MDERLNTLSRWAERMIGSPVAMEPASSDASFRRYFRLSCGGERTYIVMDAPPEQESVAIFARAAEEFRGLGLNVPRVFALDEGLGFALLTDLGSRTYLQAVEGGNVDELYDDALDALYRLQAGSRDRLDVFEPYDAAKLTAEMELFRQWFVPHRTSRGLSGSDNTLIERTFRALSEAALEQPRVWVHRDYHSRNLMVTEIDNPGMLDFQDAVSGPITYDLASLLRDCYIVWPEDRVDAWLAGYFGRVADTVLEGRVDEERFRQWFDWMGVQRHIKVLGIFARLFHRDGKADYLGDLPVVYDYVCRVCERYPELRPFGRMLAAMDVKWTS